MRQKKRVLIVDDDLEILTQLRWAMQEEFDLLLAGSPDEAAELLRDGPSPAAALVDLHLPPDTSSIDGGIDLIRSLREASMNMQIIAISAQADETAERTSRLAGAKLLLDKPVQPARLLELLNE